MDLPAPRRGPVRATLVVLVAALTAAGGGVLAAQVSSLMDTPIVTRVVQPPEEPDLTPIAVVGATLIEGVTVDLPVPEADPADPRAPTPEIHHGQLDIPSIGLSQPYFEGVTLTAIDRGPAHWPGTAMPGELGNVVIAGHRTTKSRPFWDLDLVQPGAELIFTLTTGERHVYTLDRIEIVDDQASYIVDQKYDYTATLFGCHPKGSAQQRIVGHFTLKSSTPA